MPSWKLTAAIAGVTVVLAIIAVRILRRPRPTAAELERRRRLEVNARGRTGSATITDFRDGTLSYTYSIGGVEYGATQDVSDLLALVPRDLSMLVSHPAGMKYLPQNPANSIVLCEDWSGLKFGPKGEGRPIPASKT